MYVHKALVTVLSIWCFHVEGDTKIHYIFYKGNVSSIDMY
jgi:hypothetical protein